MDNTLAAKLKIKPGHALLVLNPPPGYSKKFGTADTKPKPRKAYDFVLLFATAKADIDRHGPGALTAVKDDGLLWIAYPKKSSDIKTDITRDKGWETLKKAGYETVSLVAVDDTWSALRFRVVSKIPSLTRQPKPAKKTAAVPPDAGEIKTFKAVLERPEGDMDAAFISVPFDVEKVYGTRGHVKVKASFDGHPYRGILANMGTGCHLIIVTQAIRNAIGKHPGDTIVVELQYDNEERIVEVPADLQDALARNAKAKKFYDSLSFTNRKEYATWIASAKRTETRDKRLSDTIQKLLAGKKNPSAK